MPTDPSPVGVKSVNKQLVGVGKPRLAGYCLLTFDGCLCRSVSFEIFQPYLKLEIFNASSMSEWGPAERAAGVMIVAMVTRMFSELVGDGTYCVCHPKSS
jgi:hypothetical protein